MHAYNTCTFHDVYCSKPLTFHNGFMFFCFSLLFQALCCIFQSLTARPDRERKNVKNKNRTTTTHVHCMVCKQEGNGRQPDNTCHVIRTVISQVKASNCNCNVDHLKKITCLLRLRRAWYSSHIQALFCTAHFEAWVCS